MKPKSPKQKMRLFITIFSGIFIGSIIFISCQKGINKLNTEFSVAVPIPLNLSDDQQQSDFENYLKKTVNFLNDSSNTYLFQGYDLSNLSSNDKTQIANNMLKDHNFMNKLNVYQGMLKYIEKRYRASAFTKEQWNEVIKFGMDRGIYFLKGLKEKVRNMEEKSLAMMQNNKGNMNVPSIGSCTSAVDAANTELGYEVGMIALTCVHMSEFPPAAAFCWAGLAAYYYFENNRINSTGFWCDCMISNYGYCVY